MIYEWRPRAREEKFEFLKTALACYRGVFSLLISVIPFYGHYAHGGQTAWSLYFVDETITAARDQLDSALLRIARKYPG